MFVEQLPQIVCPAGEKISAGCRCRIEQVNIEAETSPRTFLGFCTNEYQKCSTWRMMKEQEWRNSEGAKRLKAGLKMSSEAEEKAKPFVNPKNVERGD